MDLLRDFFCTNRGKSQFLMWFLDSADFLCVLAIGLARRLLKGEME